MATAPMDVYRDGDNYVVEVAMPGVDPKDVDISVHGNQVTICGETRGTSEDRQHLHRERTFGRFERTVMLPTDVDADRAQATCENGVVRLTLPQAEHSKPRRIQISSGAGQLTSPSSQPAQSSTSAPAAQRSTTESTSTRLASTSTVGTQRRGVREGMEVCGLDDNDVGKVKTVGDDSFLVDRTMQRDVWVPFSAIQHVEGNRITLTVSADQVDQQNWPNPSLTGSSS
jgi:HSP20 family protein